MLFSNLHPKLSTYLDYYWSYVYTSNIMKFASKIKYLPTYKFIYLLSTPNLSELIILGAMFRLEIHILKFASKIKYLSSHVLIYISNYVLIILGAMFRLKILWNLRLKLNIFPRTYLFIHFQHQLNWLFLDLCLDLQYILQNFYIFRIHFV